MDDPGPVRAREALGDRDRDPYDLGHGRRRRPQQLAQRAAADGSIAMNGTSRSVPTSNTMAIAG